MWSIHTLNQCKCFLQDQTEEIVYNDNYCCVVDYFVIGYREHVFRDKIDGKKILLNIWDISAYDIRFILRNSPKDVRVSWGQDYLHAYM